MRLLLDTHALLWWVLQDQRLSKAAFGALSDPSAVLAVSSVSASEIATTFRSGKLAVPPSLAEQLAQFVVIRGWQPLALSLEHAQLAGRLPGAHKDPFDRMLAAQAVIEDIPIGTNDAAIAAFGAKVMW